MKKHKMILASADLRPVQVTHRDVAHADVAQLEEHSLGKGEVAGPIPAISSTLDERSPH